MESFSKRTLREIYQAFGQFQGKVELVADDVRYDSFEEFIEQLDGRRPKTLTIKTNNPYSTVELSSYDAKLYVGSSKLEAKGMFANITAILRRRERRPRWLYKPAYITLLTVILSLAFSLTGYFIHDSYFSVFGIFAIIAVFVWSTVLVFNNSTRFSTINAIYYHRKSRFWRNNYEKIVLIILGALIAGLAQLAFSALKDFWNKEPPPAPPMAVSPSSPSTQKP